MQFIKYCNGCSADRHLLVDCSAFYISPDYRFVHFNFQQLFLEYNDNNVLHVARILKNAYNFTISKWFEYKSVRNKKKTKIVQNFGHYYHEINT